MQTILVANPKGGSGKTTVATNVAGWLAGKRQRAVLVDRDPQRSATEWLARRPALFPAIVALPHDASRKKIKEADSAVGRRRHSSGPARRGICAMRSSTPT